MVAVLAAVLVRSRPAGLVRKRLVEVARILRVEVEVEVARILRAEGVRSIRVQHNKPPGCLPLHSVPVAPTPT